MYVHISDNASGKVYYAGEVGDLSELNSSVETTLNRSQKHHLKSMWNISKRYGAKMVQVVEGIRISIGGFDVPKVGI